GAAGAGVGHHVDRVDLGHSAVVQLLHLGDFAHHLVGDAVGGLGPGVNHLVVLLALGDQAVGVLLLVLLHLGAGGVDDLGLLAGDDDVVLAERDARLGRLAEAQRHHAVGEDDRLLLTAVAIDHVD